MPSYLFRGYVYPEELALTIAYRPSYWRTETSDDNRAQFTTIVDDGIATVEIETGEACPDALNKFHQAAMDAARVLVDTQGFLDGVPYFAVLNNFVDADGKANPLILADRSLGALCTAFGENDIERVVDMLTVDHTLALTVSDALQMLRSPHYAPIACGRVADSIVRMLSGGRNAGHWVLMRKALRVDQAYVSLLSEHSKPARHGHRVPVSAEIVRALADRTWTLLNRYFAYRLNGDRLDGVAYPLLHG